MTLVQYLMGGGLRWAASPAAADDGQSGWIASRLVSLLPDTMAELQIWVVCVVVAAGVLGGLGSRRLTVQAKKQRSGFDGTADALTEGLAVVISGLWRFAAGQPLWGEPRSDATFLHRGVLLDRRPLKSAGTLAQGADATSATSAVEQTEAGAKAPGGAARVDVWHQWPGAARSVVRLGAAAAGFGLWRAPMGTLAALAVAVPLSVVLMKAMGNKGADRTDAQTYGPGLWAALIQVLRLSGEDQERGDCYWMGLSDDLASDGARIVIRLPLQWLGHEKERAALALAVATRVPGEWQGAYFQRGRRHYAEFTPKPAPKPRPQLAPSVPWRSTGNPFKVYVGQAIEGERVVDVVVSTESDTPHWGVAGDTGSGKSTVLYIPVVHGRLNGWVVDILDNKENSMIEAEGHSGVRVHKTTRACMGAIAEFMTSMIAAEKANGLDGDPRLRQMLVPRLLVIDELPTLIRFAYTWWKFGIRQKGTPPFIDWFTIILMMGRSSGHRVVVGAQQFDNALFGGTIGRKQIGTKITIGKQDMVSWGVAFGQNAPRFGYDTDTKGRGAYADKKTDPDGGDFAWVREFQAAYITPHVKELLAEAPEAPQWFDRGEMAPWITPEALMQAQEEAAADNFLPGGDFAPLSRPVVPVRRNRGQQGGLSWSGTGTALLGTVSGTAAGTVEQAVALASERAEDEALPETYSIAEACKRGILPWSYDTARKYLLQRSKAKGVPVPDGVTDGKVTYYTEPELQSWLKAWSAAGAAA
ncbi:type IV secretory system conjugative DNA transfer family protein [Streptomyces sp. NPDC056721]|uniref:type IV secretory system conjugative DNA transfer family protein n=1 Tax=Streptomyces sp. NPDC056721 TaxID=3345923 RepID=UPI0036C596F4